MYKKRKNLYDIVWVIPYYNEEKYIESFLKNLRSQKLHSLSIFLLFVDNNSKDQTHDMIEKFCNEYKKQFKIIIETKQGIVFSRTTGLKYAAMAYRSKLLLTTDVDVTFTRNLIWKTYNDYVRNNADVVSGQLKKDSRTDLIKRLSSPKIFNIHRSCRNLEFEIFGPYFYGGFFAISTEFFRNVIDYRPEIHKIYMGEDLSLSRRCYYMGAKFVRSSEKIIPSPRKELFYGYKILNVNIGNDSKPHVEKTLVNKKVKISKLSVEEEKYLTENLLDFYTKRFLWSMADLSQFNVITKAKYKNAKSAFKRAVKFIGTKDKQNLLNEMDHDRLFEHFTNNLYNATRKKIIDYVTHR